MPDMSLGKQILPWKRWVEFIQNLETKYEYVMPVPDWFKYECAAKKQDQKVSCPSFWLWL
jgi:hypothetical protein